MKFLHYILVGLLASQIAQAMETIPGKNYRPLVIITNHPFVEFTDRKEPTIERQHAAHSGSLYILKKNTDNSFDAQEFIINRYAGSAVLKNPFFHPPKGFRCIAKNNEIPTHPLIEQYREFIANKYGNGGEWFTQLFFYKDEDEAVTNNWYIKLLKKKSPASKQLHPLISTLQKVQSLASSTQKPLINGDKTHKAFEYTNIFVDQSIPLEELKKLNSHIRLEDGVLYLNDNENIAATYTTFEKWMHQTE